MFHLETRVHLDEVMLSILIHQELDRASVLIADLTEEIDVKDRTLLGQLKDID